MENLNGLRRPRQRRRSDCMVERACKVCRFVVTEGHVCPNCNSKELTEKWSNYILIFDPENSELAKRIGAKTPGKYALRIKG